MSDYNLGIDISKLFFPGPGCEALWIKPMSYGVAERTKAVEEATALGKGVVMNVESSHTEFWADPDVPVGKIKIYMARTYKGFTEYVTTLDSPTEEFEAIGWNWGVDKHDA